MSLGRIVLTDIVRASALLIFATGQLLAGFLPDMLGWDVSIASRSAEYNTVLIPAGFAFVIWLPLFFGNIALAVFHALPKQLNDPLFRRIGWLATAAFAANTFRSLYEPLNGPNWISFLLLIAILAPLVVAAILVARTSRRSATFALAPVIGQAGWITVASAAGFSQMALFEGWNPFELTELMAAFGVIVVWTPLALTAVWMVRAIVYAAAISWGLFWIGVGNIRAEDGYLTETAWVIAAVMIVTAAVSKRIARRSGGRDVSQG